MPKLCHLGHSPPVQNVSISAVWTNEHTVSPSLAPASAGSLTFGGVEIGTLTTSAAGQTLFDNITVGNILNVTSAGSVYRQNTGILVTVNGVDTSTTSSPNVTINGVTGTLIP